MSFFQAIFLGIVQGLTEFLPVSSSGHLVIFQKIFGFTEAPIAFDALVHFGTLAALIVFFRKEILNIFKNKKLILNLAVGTIPIAFIGFLLKDKIEEIFNSLLLVGFSFLITATILFLASKVKESKKGIKEIKKLDSLIVGLFQALAILPGVSRSGSTISGAIFRDIKKEDAFNFSFFLGMIAISCAMSLQIPDIKNFSSDEIANGFLGFLFAAIVGYFSLKVLKKFVINGKLHYFGIYCAILGVICIIFGAVV